MSGNASTRCGTRGFTTKLASDPRYAGGIGWCAFDYNTHSNFGAGDRICYHGVTDIFREPKARGRLLQIAMRSC